MCARDCAVDVRGCGIVMHCVYARRVFGRTALCLAACVSGSVVWLCDAMCAGVVLLVSRPVATLVCVCPAWRGHCVCALLGARAWLYGAGLALMFRVAVLGLCVRVVLTFSSTCVCQ